jgi:hypothetical protein
MSAIYAPVMHVGSRFWMVGRIENHVARPLEDSEIQAVCDLLNAVSPTAEWLMAKCEEYQRRAHEAEREVLRLKQEDTK